MVSIVSVVINKLNRRFNEKGQGLVEFALILAFCAGIGIFAREAGFSKAINKSIEESKPELYTAAIGMKIETAWISYFKKWRHTDAATLKNDQNTREDRIKADQKALIKIAETYLGKSQGQVLDLMNYFSNSPNNNQAPYVNDLKCENDNGTGFSKGMLVPLSYQIDSQYNNALWLDANNNMNTVSYLTDGEAVLYGKNDPNNPAYNTNRRETLVMENLFYSDDMLNNERKTVSLKLHYTDNKVDKIAISLRIGTKDAKAEAIGEGLCLLLTETGYTEVQHKTGKRDIVRETPSVYADVWNIGN